MPHVRLRFCSALLALATLSISGCATSGGSPEGDPSRSFQVRYQAQVESLSPGENLRLWIPIPSDDMHQRISSVTVDSPVEYKIETDPAYGNRMVFLEGTAPADSLMVEVQYKVDRYPYEIDVKNLEERPDGSASVAALFKRPSRLGVVNDDIRRTAKELSKDHERTVDKAYAFYEHVREEMSYGKPEGLAWGNGDTVYACAAGVGNCTDFHSYFISLCLAADIPARFQIGLYGAYDQKPGTEYKTGGYHCWAEFHVPGEGWVPVDISEADKDPSRAVYFFGAHTDNRVTLSTGRDLVLSPPQATEPLNYFVNPYAEANGRPVAAKKTAFWTDLP